MRKLGRPREFDEREAMRSAMLLFWEKGFRNTTLDDLTKEMQINRPSMYAAFGDKASLFRASLDCYIADHTTRSIAFLESEPNVSDAIEKFLKESVQIFTNPRLPGGCMVACHLSDNELPEEIRAVLESLSKRWLSVLTARFKRAKQEGELNDSQDPKHMARLVVCILSGLSHSSRNGSSRRQLLATVECLTSMLR